MEKELKIAELANVWGVSVPTTWNRVKKMGLTTFIKKSETNKDINYVSISDEQINEYVINVNNNVNNTDNNGYYEDLLNVNNVNNNANALNNNVVNAENAHIMQNSIKDTIETLASLNNDYNERLLKVYEDYNNRLQHVNEELITYKSKTLLLEDKAGREGTYINEINGLRTDNKRLLTSVEKLKYVIITLIMVIMGLVMYLVMVNNVSETVINDKKPAEVQEVVTPPAPQQTLNVSNQRKR